jgi:RNA polymerase sigma-70 factor (ECF subfamily)
MALHSGGLSGSRVRQDVLDRVQDVFVLLLDRGGRVLCTWKAARGLSLENFVGLVAERETRSILRSGRRSAWAEHPTPSDVLERELDPVTPEARVSAAQRAGVVLEQVQSQLSPRGLALFEALVVDGEPLEETAKRFNVSHNALYSFRSRLKALVARVRVQIDEGGGPPQRHSEPGEAGP